MKIPEEQKTEIINGMLEMLDPDAVEIVEEIKNVSGRDLINLHGLFKDAKGGRILPAVLYSVTTTTRKKLNHKQRIAQIIADSSTQDEWTERLGVYLSKYAKDKGAVINSIPVHLSLQNIKRNDN